MNISLRASISTRQQAPVLTPRAMLEIRSRLSKTVGLVILLVVGLVLQACSNSTSRPLSGSAALAAIQITPSTPLLQLAGTRQLIATGLYSDGSSQDLTSQVTWNASSAPSTTNFVSVNSTGLVTGMGLGSAVISATLGSIVGALNLIVETNGFSSSTTGILTVTLQNNLVDVAYQPQNQVRNPQGLYTVQEINLDTDVLSATIPPPTALVYSIPMPSGFVPNSTAASQDSLEVAVISYSSPDVQVIDASNDPTDLNNNTIVGTFTAPVTGKATFNGITCMICAAVINPANDQLLLSTAQGYYSMDLSTGTFTALPFTPSAFASPAFTLNPVASSSYILSPTFGQDPKFSSELQVLNLTSNTATDITNLGLISPTASAINLFASLGVVTDSGSSAQALLNLATPGSPSSILVSNIGTCGGSSGPPLSMAALGVAASSIPDQVSPTLFLSQLSGNCVGFELWPTTQSGSPFDPTQIDYGYGPLPATPDGNAFSTGNDPNAIGTFTSVVDKKNYGFLVNSTQNWIAKINLATVVSEAALTDSPPSTPLPKGEKIEAGVLITGLGGAPVVYLSTAAQTGVVSVTSSNNIVQWVSGAQFAIGGQWNGGTITLGGTLPGCVGGTSYIVSSVSSPTQLTLASNFLGSTGNTNYCFPGTPIPTTP